MKTMNSKEHTRDTSTVVATNDTLLRKDKKDKLKKKRKKKKKQSYQSILNDILKPASSNEDKYKEKILQSIGGGNHQKVLQI